MSSYFAPYIDSNGFHRPTYSQILDNLISNYKSIYGQDVYLGNDSADYQWISIVAYRLNDAILALEQEYQNRSPLTATGTALDSLVKINGITRKEATYSTCEVTITGTALTIISNGVIQDSSGYLWDLPQVTIIGTNGTVTAIATCQTEGSIMATVGSITTIMTPQYGWNSVTNASEAVVGQPIETDEQLRARQALSTRLASHTMLSGTEAGIAAVADVTRWNIHENYSSVIDSENCPPHSITCIVEGGTDLDVATAIFLNKGIGCDTYGGDSGDPYLVEELITDEDTGDQILISFRRPEYKPVYVDITIKALTGYVSSIADEIITAICDYLNSLQIGQSLTISALYSTAMSVMEDIKTPAYSVTSILAGYEEGELYAVDLPVQFDEVTQGIISESPKYITITVT
jgi:uncharacterized phage protein gp47/JayE